MFTRCLHVYLSMRSSRTTCSLVLVAVVGPNDILLLVSLFSSCLLYCVFLDNEYDVKIYCDISCHFGKRRFGLMLEVATCFDCFLGETMSLVYCCQ